MNRASSIRISIVLLMTSVLVLGCDSFSSIQSPKKSIRSIGNYVSVEGRWKRLQDTSRCKYLPKINTVKLSCYKKTMTCEENMLELWTPKEDGFSHKGMMTTANDEYKIVEWTDDGVIKVFEHRGCLDIEFKISVKDNFAERSFRETQASGNETASTDIYGHWVLE